MAKQRISLSSRMGIRISFKPRVSLCIKRQYILNIENCSNRIPNQLVVELRSASYTGFLDPAQPLRAIAWCLDLLPGTRDPQLR
jgi:hypothetical protein